MSQRHLQDVLDWIGWKPLTRDYYEGRWASSVWHDPHDDRVNDRAQIKQQFRPPPGARDWSPPVYLTPKPEQVLAGVAASAATGVPGVGLAAGALAGSRGGTGMASVEEVKAQVDEAVAKLEEAKGQLEGAEQPIDEGVEKLQEAAQGSGQQAFNEAVEKAEESKQKIQEARDSIDEAIAKAQEAAENL